MGGTQTKIVLGGLSDDDAEIMAREIMRGDIDLKRPKRGITAPVVVDEVPFWLESKSFSEGSAESRASAESFATSECAGMSESTGEMFRALEGQNPELQGLSTTTNEMSSTA